MQVKHALQNENQVNSDGYDQFSPIAANENEDLFRVLELRYGGAFAQWIVDGLNAATPE